MKGEYVFKIICDRKNIFHFENGRFDIKNEIDALSYYPVVIEMRGLDDIDNEIDGELVATITGFYFNIENMRECGFRLLDVFDSIDQDTYDLYEALFTDEEYKDEFEVCNQNLFYLEDIRVEESYQDKELYEMIINQVDEIIKYMACLNVGVIATNLCVNEDVKLNHKLEDVLIDKGFVKASSDNSYYILEIL